MKNLLIVGCGDVMRRVLPQLTKHWRVIALVRQRDEALERLGVLQICGDLDHRHTLRRLPGIAAFRTGNSATRCRAPITTF